MTEHQIEIAARKLCELRGWKENSLISGRVGSRKESLDYARTELNGLPDIVQAIAYALSQQEPK